MLQEERYQKILNYLQLHHTVKVNDLVKMLDVSADTVRRDLEHLESKGSLKRVHGGAVYNGDDLKKQSFTAREIKFKEEKSELADKALDYISEGDAIAINAGTTTIELAKKIVDRFERLTIITNALRIAEILSVNKNFTIIVLGGILNNQEHSTHGRKSELQISQYNINTAFITVNAISLEKGITDFRLDEVDIIKAMMQRAQKTIVVADSSKFEALSYINVCPLREIDLIVTDSKVKPEIIKRYNKENIDIVKAQIN